MPAVPHAATIIMVIRDLRAATILLLLCFSHLIFFVQFLWSAVDVERLGPWCTEINNGRLAVCENPQIGC